MSSKKAHLEGYGTVTIIVDEEQTSSTQTSNIPNESWVEAHVLISSEEGEETHLAYKSTRGTSTYQQEETRGPVLYRDQGFAILFIFHLISFIAIGAFYGDCNIDNYSSSGDDASSSSSSNSMVDGGIFTVTGMIFASFLLAAIVTYAITAFVVPKFPTIAVISSLYGSFIINTMLVFALFSSFPNIFTFILGLAVIIWNMWYIYAVRIFVPFAVANLKLATKAVSTNFGVYFVSLLNGIIGIIWMGFWCYTADGLGLFGEVQQQDDGTGTSTGSAHRAALSSQNKDDYYYSSSMTVDNAIVGFKGFGLLLSLYWTMNVLSNITQTTIAGVTGTWCFDKDNATSCCSSAVTQSLYRSCTYSFGSICFGSLLTALVTALRVIAQQARDNNSRRNSRNEGAALLLCILTCILALLEDIIEYFNQWAYIFVGIWGLDYLESGKRVLELFQARGCTAIITNGLASYVLTNIVMFSSLVCGSFGYIAGGDGASFWYVCMYVEFVEFMFPFYFQKSKSKLSW